MCTTNVYTYVYPDGRKETLNTPTLCSASRHNHPCANNVVFQHPTQSVAYPAYANQLPPTPSYTPRSTTPNYRSGDESDRSYGSNSSRQRRSSSVYINGQRVLDLNRRDRHARQERIVLVDNPPTPRTPPQTYNAPHTAPSSPNVDADSSPYVVEAAPRESSSRRRPVIVDERAQTSERPRIQIQVVDHRDKSSKHSRHTSTSSRDSRRSHSSHRSTDDEEARQRRLEREREREREREELRELKIRERIAKANAEINGRPPVPVPAAPKRASTYTRGTVEVPYEGEAELVEAVQRMTFEEARREEKARRLAKKEEEREKEAQRQRLVERMMPRRRATVGPGSRRHRVLYDDGLYRWE